MNFVTERNDFLEVDVPTVDIYRDNEITNFSELSEVSKRNYALLISMTMGNGEINLIEKKK